MIDAHCHITAGDDSIGEILIGRDMLGTHPWDCDRFDADSLRAALIANPDAGVGEIGLDRLKERNISARMREVFEAQLAIAAELHRPVVLHGAKCWGEVVRTVCAYRGRIPAFLFHGFSRSDGLLPDIFALNGFISVGPAVLNDHAVNYRALVKKIPRDRLLVETDRCQEHVNESPSIRDVLAKTAELLSVPIASLIATTDANALSFTGRVESG